MTAGILERNVEVEVSPVGGHHGARVSTVLVCSNALARMGLRQILSDSCFVVTEEVDGDAPHSACRAYLGAVLFVVHASDPAMASGAVRQLKEAHPGSRVVILINHLKGDGPGDLIAAGADGIFQAGTDGEVLVKSLELVMAGQLVFSPEVVRSLVSVTARTSTTDQCRGEGEVEDPKINRLSCREAQILRLLMEGSPNKVIARKLDVTEATVKVHVKAILRKVGAANRTQAAMWATGHLPKEAANLS